MKALFIVVIFLVGLLSLWRQAQTKSPRQVSPELLVAEEDNSKSLAYALGQIKQPSRDPVLNEPTAEEIETYLSQLRLFSHLPEKFHAEIAKRLERTKVERLAERTLLLKEAVVVLGAENQAPLRDVVDRETQWLRKNFSQLKKIAALKEYINELVYISTQAYVEPQQKFNQLDEVAKILKADAVALKYFRKALVTNSQWDITDIFEQMPSDLQKYVQGKDK